MCLVPRTGPEGVVVAWVMTAYLPDDTVILDAATEAQQIDLAVAGGVALVYSRRDPDKNTENEDTVAVIPYGPAAAVLVVADGAGGLPAGKRASLSAVQALARFPAGRNDAYDVTAHSDHLRN